MNIRIGINGFERIGRRVLRAEVQTFENSEFAGVNALKPPARARA